MTKSFILLLAVLALNSCIIPATEEQKRTAMQNATFDKALISKLSQYEELKAFLEVNADNIISYRDQMHAAMILKIRKEGGPEVKFQYQNCYRFSRNYKSNDYTDVPNYLKQKLNDLCNSIGGANLNAFYICRDKNIIIEMTAAGGENGLYIGHTLNWNSKFLKDSHIVGHKDTLISKNCIYRISLIEFHGG